MMVPVGPAPIVVNAPPAPGLMSTQVWPRAAAGESRRSSATSGAWRAVTQRLLGGARYRSARVTTRLAVLLATHQDQRGRGHDLQIEADAAVPHVVEVVLDLAGRRLQGVVVAVAD